MHIDYTLNLGNAVSLVVLLIAIFKIRDNKHKENLQRFDAIEKQLDELRKPWELMWQWFKKEHGILDDK